MGNSKSVYSNLEFIPILNKSEAQTTLNSAEKKDFYLAECHDHRVNSIARRSLTYNANSISLSDRNYVYSYLDSIMADLPMRLVSDLEKVYIIQLMPTADGGMPHTRANNIICYPDISQLFSRTTLIHELWHIHQRLFNNDWLDIFKKMGWNTWEGKLPPQLEDNRRYNPDTIDNPLFIYQDKWVPVPIFKDISKPNMAEVEIWFYNPEKGYHIRNIPDEISSYMPHLPPSAYEHPREMTAYMLSEPKLYSTSRAFADLIELIGQISIMTSENKHI